MNRNLHRIKFSKRLGMLVAVAETARAQGKSDGFAPGSGASRGAVAAMRLVAFAAACVAAGQPAWAGPPLPTGGTITTGSGSISQSGNTLTVNQSSQSLSANWQSFNIGAGNSVVFVQPNASSVALNRVIGPDASAIYGSLSANGKVFLVNPNGVLFAPGAQVSVGGLVASTLAMSDADFAAGRYRFTGGTGAGSIVNNANINAGSVVLVAPKIVNNGVISTPGGNTTLAAGDRVTVSLMDGLLTAQVDASVLNAEIQNHGQILADGGRVSMLAGRADTVLDSLINTDGIVQARGLRSEGGKIYLDAGAGGAVNVSGALDASASNGAGGEARVLGESVTLAKGASVDVSGATSGGSALIGGDLQGKNTDVHNARTSTVESGATVRADGGEQGGRVIVWADDATRFNGSILARGKGFAEVSGKGTLQFSGSVDTGGGTLLLDPANITVQSTAGDGTNTLSGAQIATLLGSSDVVLAADNNVTWNSGVTLDYNGVGTRSLTLQAGNNISYAGTITDSVAGGDKLHVTFNADANGDGVGGIALNGGSIRTSGGDIVLRGGSGALAALPSFTDAGYETALRSSAARNVAISSTTLDAAGGNIAMRGVGLDTGTSAGVNLSSSTVQTSGTGTITIDGIAGAGAAGYNRGIQTDGTTTISTVDGALTLQGTGNGTGIENMGVRFNGTTVQATGNGDVVINALGSATGSNYADGIVIDSSTVRVANGNMTVTGTGRGTGVGGDGIELAFSALTEATGTGNVTLNGTSIATGADTNRGVTVWLSSIARTASGALTIQGSSADPTKGNAISLEFDGALGGTGQTGAITLTGDTINLASGTVRGTGSLLLQPLTLAGSIGLGDGATGTFNLSSGELALLQNGFSSITVGRADGGGAVDVRTAAFNDPLTIRTPAGSGSIAVNGTLSTGTGASLGSITLQAGGDVSLNNGTIDTSDALGITGASYTVTGASTLKSNTLAFGNTNTITDNGTLTFNQTADATVANAINGSGALVKAGGNKLTLTGDITYGGGTTVDTGILQIGDGGGGATTGSVGTGAVTINSGGTLQFFRSNVPLGIGNDISGTGTLSFLGTGVAFESDYWPSGNNSGFTGTVIVDKARLYYDSPNDLGATANITVLPGAGLFAVANIPNPMTLNGNGWPELSGSLGALRLGGGATASGNITLQSDSSITAYNSTGTISGTISGNANLTKAQAGTLTLTGSNTYTGTTTVSGGTLAVTNPSGLGDTSGGTVVDGGGNLDLQNVAVGAESVTLAGGSGAGTYGTLTTSTGTSSLSGPVTLAGPSYSFFNVASGAQLTVSGVISGPGGVFTSNAGTLVFGGANTYSGGTQLGLSSSGTLAITNNSGLGTGNVNLRASTTLDLRNVAISVPISANGGTILASTGVNTISGNVSSFSNVPVNVLDGVQLTIASNMTTPTPLVKDGNGVLTLTGNNTRGGTTTINAGTVQVGNGGTSGTLGTGAVTNNGTLTFNRSDALAVANTIGGTGNVVQAGTGTTTLSGTNTYSGTTTVNAGTLAITNPSALGDTSGGTTVNGGATLDLQNVAVGNESVTLAGSSTLNADKGTLSASTGTSSLSGPVTLAGPSASIFSVGSGAELTVSGTISGAGGIAKSGAGTLVLSGANTFTGANILGGGTVAVTNNLALGSSASPNVDYTSINTGATLELRNVSIGEQITGNGGTILASTGVNSISGSFFSFTTLPVNVLDGVQLTLSGTSTTATPLVKNGGGTLILTGNNTRTSATTVNAGTLQVGNDGTTGTLGSGAVTVASGANLVFNRSDTVNLSTLASNAAGITGQGNVSALIGGGFNVDRAINLTGATSSILLEAGKNQPAGTASGGNVTLTSNIATSATGTVTIFSGIPNTAALEAKTSGATGATRYKTYNASVGDTAGAVAGTRNYYYRQSFAGTVNGVTATKTYDGLVDATGALNTSAATLSNSDGDVVSLGGLTLTGATFSSAHAGSRAFSASFAATGPLAYTSSGVDWSVARYTAKTGFAVGTITPKTVTTAINAVDKTYDGTTNTTSTLTAPTGFVGNDSATGVTGISLAFDNPNAGTRNVVATGTGAVAGFTGAARGNGSGVGAGNEVAGLASDYVVTAPPAASATISPAALTITANNDAKIVTQADAPGYAGASFTGFVAGESSANLGGSLSITRSNAGTEAAGSYAGVLVPSGYTSGNYNITYVNGDYRIVPAQELLVRIQDVNNAYGTIPGYAVSTAQYMDAGSTIHTLTQTAHTGDTFTYSDGVGGSVTFTVAPNGAVQSGAGFLAAGNYSLAGAGTSIVGSNFGTLTYVGSQTVNPIALTPSASGVTKVYDGTTSMTGLSMDLSGKLAGDTVTVTAGGAFSTKNAGSNIGYTVSGIALGGADAGNYYLTSNSLSGTNGVITPRPVTVSGVTANDKVYDSTTTATVNTSGATLNNTIAGDAVALNSAGVSANFDTKNVGTGKTVTLSGLTLTGADAANYQFNPATGGLTASITPATIDVSGVTANNKVYDSTTTATLGTGYTLNGVFGGDTVTLNTAGATANFDTKNVGTGKAVTVSALALGGADAGNYQLSGLPTGLTADVTPAPLGVSGITASNKVYDGTTAASVTTGGATLTGVFAGDTVSLDAAATAANFDTKNVGTAKPVTVSGLALTGADAANYQVTGLPAGLTADITPASLTVSGITANNKVYDATTAATLGTGYSLAGVIGGDNVTVNTAGANAQFDTKNVGTGKAVTVNSLPLAGADAGNYQITALPTGLTANITPAPLTVTGVTASDKVYDGTTAATLNTGGATLTGAFAGDAVSLSAGGASAQFDTKNVGTNKPVTVSGLSVTGADAGNYRITVPSSLAADITPRPVTVSGLGANDKVYDGTTAASLTTGSYSLNNTIAGDSVSLNVGALSASFVDKNVGTDKSVNVTGLSLSGADAGNYRLTASAGLTADITPRPLTVTGVVANDKVYDGTTAATLSTSGTTLSGAIAGDSVALSAGSASFADKNVGTNKPVTVSGLTLTGADAGNYQVTLPSGFTANITPRTLTVAAVGDSRVYDGTTGSTGKPTVSGLVAGDTTTGVALQSFDTRDAGTGKTLTPTLGTLVIQDGNGGGNYVVAFVKDATGTITPRPITVTAVPDSKVYDGTTASGATPLVSGTLAAGDTFATLNEVYASAQPGTGLRLVPVALVNDGNGGANYVITLVDNLAGEIRAATTTPPPVQPGDPQPPVVRVGTDEAPRLNGDWQDDGRERVACGRVYSARQGDCSGEKVAEGLVQVISTGLRLPSGAQGEVTNWDGMAPRGR